MMPGPEYLTVKEVADLLRLKERKVYDLAASGDVPCSRATGKLLFPADEVRAWIEAAASGRAERASAPAIVLGSHDPLLDWAIRQSGCGLATWFDGSLDGVERMLDGGGIAAAMHLYDRDSKSWNVTTARTMTSGANVVLIDFAKRQRGLVVGEGVRLPNGISDLEGLSVVPRQPGSGTERLFAALSQNAGIDIGDLTYTDIHRTEDDAVEAVRLGTGDVTLGLQSLAQSFHLRFVPLVEESLALLVDRRAYFEAPFQAFLDFCGSDAFVTRADALGGYDITDLGAVAWNAA